MQTLKFNAVKHLPSTFEVGSFYLLPSGDQFIGISESNAIELTDVKFITSLPSSGTKDKLYVVVGSSLNIYAWNGTKWLNLLDGVNAKINTNENEINNHKNISIATEEGSHGIRFYNGKLEVKSNSNWIELIATDEAAEISITVNGISPDANGNIQIPLFNGDYNSLTNKPSNATTTKDGFMSSTSFVKLNGIENGANKTVINNTLTSTSSTEALSAAKGRELKQLIDGKSPTSHAHSISDISGLQDTLNGKATSITYNATISANWVGTDAPFTQVVTVNGILASDNPIISPVLSDTMTTAIEQQNGYNLISRAKTSSNSITFICYGEKPTVSIPIQVKVVR